MKSKNYERGDVNQLAAVLVGFILIIGLGVFFFFAGSRSSKTSSVTISSPSASGTPAPAPAPTPAVEEEPAPPELPPVSKEDAKAQWATALDSADAIEVEVGDRMRNLSTNLLSDAERANLGVIAARFLSMRIAHEALDKEIDAPGFSGPPRAIKQMETSAIRGEMRAILKELEEAEKPFSG